MATLLRLMAVALSFALLGVGQAQAYDEDDDAFYSYYTRPIVYYRPAHYFQPAPYYHYYRPYYYQPARYYGRYESPSRYHPEPGTLPGVSERTHDRTGTLPGVVPRYNDAYVRGYGYGRYGYGYGRGYGYGYDGYEGRSGTCGRYHYQRHGHCADARWRPPFKRYYPIYRYVTIIEVD